MQNRGKPGGLELAADITRALDAREFEVHYQPVIRLHDRRPVAVEALVRWAHPLRGLLSPMEFVPFAEATGLMNELGSYVLRQACTDMLEFAPGLDLCVNASDTQLAGSGLVNTVIQCLVDTGYRSDHLILEVCERTVIPDLEPLARALGSLRALGVRVALDDFGAGFSSLERLSRLPLDVVKIDACLIRGLDERANDRHIVEAVLGLAGSLGLDVVSEGVETPAQADVLIDLGCAQGQGYLFARPGPASTLARWNEEAAKLEPVPIGRAAPTSGKGHGKGDVSGLAAVRL